VRSIWKKCCK